MATYCITGARGFIGRHLARALADDGNRVFGLGHGAWPDAATAGLDLWINGDIDTPNLSALANQASGFDAIFHLAGGSAVGPSLARPREDFERTVAATARLLDWMRQIAPATRLVTASSAAVYGDAGTARSSEAAALDPTSPYGTHKAMLEALVGSYRRHFKLAACSVRLFSVYGRGLEKQLLFELCRRCAAADQGAELALGGTGQEQRDWLHVSDAVALLRIAAGSDVPPILNGGTGVPTAVAAIAAMVCNEWRKDLRPIFSGIVRKGDPANLVADPDRARAAGFVARTDVALGVHDYVAWFRQNWR